MAKEKMSKKKVCSGWMRVVMNMHRTFTQEPAVQFRSLLKPEVKVDFRPVA